MGIVAALVPNPARLYRLRAAIRGRHSVEQCADWAGVTRLCEMQPVHLAVLDLFAGGTMSLEPLRQLKRRFPKLSTVAYVSASTEQVRDVFDAGRAGVDALVLADVDDEPATLNAILEQAEARGVAGLLKGLVTTLRPSVRDALLIAVTRSHERLTPEGLSRVLAMSRRVLANHLAEAELPPPQRLLTWGRLVVAAHLLEDPQRSADGIAIALHFPSGSAFRNTCQRYLHATPSEIRANGGAEWVIGRMIADGRNVVDDTDEIPDVDADVHRALVPETT